MMKLNRIIALLLILTLLSTLISCGEYHQATGGGSDDGKGEGENKPTLDDDPTNDFTVQLRLNEQPFSPATAVAVLAD